MRDIERWRATLTCSPRDEQAADAAQGHLQAGGKVYGLPRNPAEDVEELREPRYTDLEVFPPEEVHALVHAAASEQDAAIYSRARSPGCASASCSPPRWRDLEGVVGFESRRGFRRRSRLRRVHLRAVSPPLSERHKTYSRS